MVLSDRDCDTKADAKVILSYVRLINRNSTSMSINRDPYMYPKPGGKSTKMKPPEGRMSWTRKLAVSKVYRYQGYKQLVFAFACSRIPPRQSTTG